MVYDPWSAVLEEVHAFLASASPGEALPVEEPPETRGDLAVATFGVAKSRGMDPRKLASDVAASFRPTAHLRSAKADGGYVNFSLDPADFAKLVLDTVSERGESYGSLPPRSARVLLEHTSVNPTGPIHVGRARNPIVADTLVRCFRLAGYPITAEYLVNDAGKQIVLLYWGATHLRPGDVRTKASAKEDHALLPYYVRANELAEADPSIRAQVDELIRRFERGDPALMQEIRKVAERVLSGILETLTRIGIRFDSFFWESDLILQGKVPPVVERLTALPEARSEDGAYYIDMAPFGVTGRDTKWFLTKKDGTSLYPTRDVAYHLDKFSRCDVAINVLGENHRLEFQQLRVALKLLGARDVEAVFYAYVGLPEGTMSTRRGRVVTVDDLVDEAVERAYAEVSKRRADLPEERKRAIAEFVGIGALRYNIVRIQAEKSIVFRWEEALNFEGNSAPFLQYAHARTCGILAKSEGPGDGDPSLLTETQEFRLLKRIAKFPSTIEATVDARAPHVLAQYALDLASTFNLFYRDSPVLQADRALRSARLRLVRASRITLGNALDALGLAAPEEM